MKPLPAATIALVRDAREGLEVLLLQRSFESGFMPGVHVFPGGGLDPGDESAEAHERSAGPADDEASRMLGIECGGLAYFIAAIRESYEEAGILLAYGDDGGIVDLNGEAAERYRTHRRALDQGRSGLGEIACAENLRLATDRLVYFSHWITPIGAPRRYDTRFFLAAAPPEQEAEHDNREAIAHAWMRPAEALERYRRKEIKLRTPTIKSLELLSQFALVDSLTAALRAQNFIPALLPRISKDGRNLLPGDPGYDEAGEAAGRGQWKT
ncbi:MAG: NUDIX hydrolase [Gammaproteobacteria bacterium]|nr:NUDIX hydrolase [Gammaproteobacteria bacterium]